MLLNVLGMLTMQFEEGMGTIMTVTDCVSSILEVTDLTTAVVAAAGEEDTWAVEVVDMNLDEDEVAHLRKEQITEL